MRSRIPEPVVCQLCADLRLVHIHDRHAVSGILGVAVRAGSSDEESNAYGLAHFVEHTIFKGTRRRNSWHIINRMESVGGELNAYTTKEATVIYSIFPASATARAVELISDLVINSQFPAKELEKEREVILDEINSYLDSPSEAIFDDFEDLAFAGTGFGHNILGSSESVKAIDSNDCRSFLDRFYHGPNMVVFYSGPSSVERISARVTKYFAGLDGTPVSAISSQAPAYEHFDRNIQLPIHQSHVVLGRLIQGDTAQRRYAAALFSNIVGGPGMNSLLNVELRERRGLVYTVEAATTFYGGMLSTVYFGCDESDRAMCTKVCHDIFSDMANGKILTQRRLDKARKQYLGQLAVAVENRESRILAAARATLFYGRPTSNEQMRQHIEALTIKDISDIASQMSDFSILSYVPEN